uniref:Uncharacterized protein n=1 Tax=Arundo donax TaxID=35708 RepID=A0A0A9FA36_ARUDO
MGKYQTAHLLHISAAVSHQA